MKTLIATALALALLAGAAIAQTPDWDPNTWGVYFDEGATQTAAYASAGSSVTTYLVVTNPSFGQPVVAWDLTGLLLAGFTSFPSPETDGLVLGLSARHGGVVTPLAPCDVWSGLANELCVTVALGTPLMFGGTTVLADITAIVPDVSQRGFFTQTPLTLTLDNAATVNLVTAVPPVSTMPPTWSVLATVNSDLVPVPTEDESWGAVKALYR